MNSDPSKSQPEKNPAGNQNKDSLAKKASARTSPQKKARFDEAGMPSSQALSSHLHGSDQDENSSHSPFAEKNTKAQPAQSSPTVQKKAQPKKAGAFSLGQERVQKILARAGFGSRRKCEELILAGRVAINGERQTQLGCKADAHYDVVSVDGERVKLPQPIYYIIHKPKGWYCSDDVPDKKILDLLPPDQPRLFTVGRLDKLCEGLMLATNDGAIANILTHPKYKIPKVYKIIVQGHVKFEEVAQIERALFYAIRGGSFERIKILKRTPKSSGLRLTVYEGLSPAFRDICNRFGHAISKITRVRVGTIELGSLAQGRAKKLNPEEIAILRDYCKDVESGKFHINKGRLVTAESIKKAADRTPAFTVKEKGHRASDSGKSTGQRKSKHRFEHKKKSEKKRVSHRKPGQGHARRGSQPRRSSGSTRN